MGLKGTRSAPLVRELFIEELADIRGGSGNPNPTPDPCCTTMACCEEGSFGCCPLPVEIGP
jgi:hypothetical protein